MSESQAVRSRKSYEKTRQGNPAWQEKHKVEMRGYRAKLKRENPEAYKLLNWNYRLMTRYGITADQYNALLKKQGGRCAICRGLPGKTRLAIDHSHETGFIRGLLCSYDNRRLLGNLKTDTLLVRLSNALDYIKNPPAESFSWAAVPKTKPKRRKKK